jgi:MFS family permease
MPMVPLRRNRDFMLLQSGQLLSNAGTQATTIAYPLVVLALTHSAVDAGVVAFVRALLMAVVALPAGVAADRGNRRLQMISADVTRAVALTVLAVSLVEWHTPFWVIPLIAGIEGAGAAVFNAAQPGALRSVVATEQLPAAAGAQAGRQAVVRIVGPALGGTLYEVGRALPFVADACSYAFSTASLLFMRTRFQEDRVRDLAGLVDRFTEGFTFLWGQPFLRVTTFLFGLLNFTAPGLLFCIVVIGEDQGLSAGKIGLLTAGFAASVLVGSLISSTVRRVLSVRAVLLLEVWAWIGCALFLVWPTALALTIGLVPVGLVIPSTDSVVHGYRIAMTPDRILGRSESVRSAIGFSIGSLAPLIAGLLLQHTTARWTIAFFTLWALGLATWGTLSSGLRAYPRELPLGVS